MITITSRLLSELHPTVVHWPFTLAGLALAADLLSYRKGGAGYAQAGWILLWILNLAMILGDATGFLATGLLTLPESLMHHVWVVAAFALLATAFGILALAARRRSQGANGPPAPTLASTLFLSLSFVLLGLGDHAGFGLIRRWGLGTRPGYPSAVTIALPPALLGDLGLAFVAGAVLFLLFLRSAGFRWRLTHALLQAAARAFGGKGARGRT